MKDANQVTTEKPKDIKLLTLVYDISLVLNLVGILYIAVTFGSAVDFSFYSFIIITYLSLVVVLVIILGLLRYAKWGLYLALGLVSLT